MKASYHTSTRVVGLAFLAGLWAAACTPSNNNAKGGGGSSSHSSSGKTGGTTGSSSAQTGGATSSSTGGTTGSSSAQTGGATSTDTTTAGGGSSSGGSSGGDSSSGGSSGSASSGGGSSGGASSGGASSGGDSSSGDSSGGASSGGASSGGGSSGGGSSGGTTSTDTGCPIVWDWEGTTVDGWITDADVTLAVSTTQKFTGTQSLKATIPALTSTAGVDGGAAATSTVRGFYIKPPSATSNMWPGATVTAHVWVPAGTTGAWMQLFTQSNNWATWTNSPTTMATAGAWTTLTFTVPAATAVFPGGINQFAVQFGVSAGNSFAGGDIFIDSITVCGGTQACSGTDTGSFDFETAASTDGWSFKGATGVTDTVVTQSTAQHYGTTGTGSLKVAMTAIPVAPAAGSTTRRVELANAKAYCGQTVTFHVMADNITGLNIQPYAAANGWADSMGTAATLTAIDSWTEVKFTIPATISFLGLQAIGLQLGNTSTTATYTGNVYVDGISWQ